MPFTKVKAAPTNITGCYKAQSIYFSCMKHSPASYPHLKMKADLALRHTSCSGFCLNAVALAASCDRPLLPTATICTFSIVISLDQPCSFGSTTMGSSRYTTVLGTCRICTATSNESWKTAKTEEIAVRPLDQYSGAVRVAAGVSSHSGL